MSFLESHAVSFSLVFQFFPMTLFIGHCLAATATAAAAVRVR